MNDSKMQLYYIECTLRQSKLETAFSQDKDDQTKEWKYYFDSIVEDSFLWSFNQVAMLHLHLKLKRGFISVSYFYNFMNKGTYFHRIGPSGPIRSSSRDVRCLSVCCPLPMRFFRGLSLALRSHDQIPASHWSTPSAGIRQALACSKTGLSIGHASILLHAWSLKNGGWV